MVNSLCAQRAERKDSRLDLVDSGALRLDNFIETTARKPIWKQDRPDIGMGIGRFPAFVARKFARKLERWSKMNCATKRNMIA
jgi:hypothetical protein